MRSRWMVAWGWISLDEGVKFSGSGMGESRCPPVGLVDLAPSVSSSEKKSMAWQPSCTPDDGVTGDSMRICPSAETRTISLSVELNRCSSMDLEYRVVVSMKVLQHGTFLWKQGDVVEVERTVKSLPA